MFTVFWHSMSITFSVGMERGWIKPNVEISSPACPRCGSSNTKFCYYNNYSLTQPRYFCKACRRYWTKGGSLRNLPVGGGCRKSRRGKSINRVPSTDGAGTSSRNLFAHNTNNNGIETSSCASVSDVSTSDSTTIDLAAVYANFLNQAPRPDPNHHRVNHESLLSEFPEGIGIINPPVGFSCFQSLNTNGFFECGHFQETQLLGGGNSGFSGTELEQQVIITAGNNFSGFDNPMGNAILPPLPGEDDHVRMSWPPGSDVILQNQILLAPIDGNENPGVLDGNVSPFSPLINLEAIFRS